MLRVEGKEWRLAQATCLKLSLVLIDFSRECKRFEMKVIAI